MQIARVLGTVVSTQKEPSLQGSKFLLLQFIDETGEALPGYEVAIDCVGAGFDEWVLVSRGSAARQVPRSESRPSDAAVVAIIDTINAGNRSIYSKREQDR
ncbi:MAG: EutN/CcmL family microcompartment protein [Microcoleaceae cyanobacterium]